jgi:hypothetical protein
MVRSLSRVLEGACGRKRIVGWCWMSERVLRSAEAGLGPSGAALALAISGISAQGASFVTLELP